MIIITKVTYNKDEVQQKLNLGMSIEEIVEQANIIIGF